MNRFHCATCGRRTRWCRPCQTRHCSRCSPHVSRRRKYLHRVLTIRRTDGTHRFMAARRYAHLKGAQKGGRTTATRPNPGRFTPATARKASLARWLGRHKVNARTGLRLGLPRKKTRPEVSRAHLRYLYSRVPRAGIRCLMLETGVPGFTLVQWARDVAPGEIMIISEDTALRTLGHLPARRKNWVPAENEPIVADTVGTDPAARRARREKQTV